MLAQKGAAAVVGELVLGEPLGGPYLAVAEVASIMRVSRTAVYRLVHVGQLPAVRIGRVLRVPEQAVHDHLRQSFVDTA